MLDLSLQFESKLRFLQQPQISLEALFIKLSMMETSVDIASILSGDVQATISVKKPEPQKSSTTDEIPPSPANPAEPEDVPLTEKNPVVASPVLAPKTQTISEPQPEAIKQLTLEDFRNHWNKIIEGLEKKNSKISHFLEEAKLTSFDGNQLLI